MRKIVMVFLATLCNSALGETKAINGTAYYTRVDDREMVELDSNRSLQANYSRHLILTLEGGQTESHWCSGSNLIGKRALIGGGGSCIAVDDDGDAYWIWFEVAQGGFEWRVMQGVGKFAGATGQGRAQGIHTLADGSAVFQYTGTIELET